MKALRDALNDPKLSRVAAQIEAAAKRSVRLSADKPGDHASSRLGGLPNLPEEFEWPMWRDQPLAFVAQLDLATLPELPDLPLPRTGSLSFFFEGGESWGFSPEDAGSALVAYRPEPLSSLPLRPLPDDLEDHLRFEGVSLQPEAPELTVPGFQDQVLVPLAMTREEREGYFNFAENFAEGKPGTLHRIGGYPDCIQGDPKVECELVAHGLYCGDQSGYKTGKERGLFSGANDWQLLLQVDSDERANMMWGDVGRIYFLIHKSALAERRFDKSWLIFQCF
jgi:uncharacterized protein YwqG